MHGRRCARSGICLSVYVQIQVLNKKGERMTLRAMLDTGSQVEMISKTAADRLGWDIYGQPVSIRGIGGGELQGELQRTHGQMDFTIMLPGGVKYKLTCHVLDELVGELCTSKLPADNAPLPRLEVRRRLLGAR